GYACASKGLQVSADAEPFMKTPPPPARVDEALPYDYAYVKRWNSPMWWRVPTREEIASAEVLRSRRESERIAAEAALAGSKPGAKPKPAEPKPAEPKAAEPKPGERKPEESKPESSLPSLDDDEDAKPERAAPRMPGALSPRKDPLDDDTA